MVDITVRIPIQTADGVLLIEPRYWRNGAPVWDSTDQIYINYDLEGNRVVATQANQ